LFSVKFTAKIYGEKFIISTYDYSRLTVKEKGKRDTHKFINHALNGPSFVLAISFRMIPNNFKFACHWRLSLFIFEAIEVFE
jgi:hypothetical protein